MKRNRKIACYSSVIVFCIGATVYLALLLVPNKTVVIVVPILFSLFLANNCFFRMIKLIVEPAGERQSELAGRAMSQAPRQFPW
jgi:hypothetical protein